MDFYKSANLTVFLVQNYKESKCNHAIQKKTKDQKRNDDME